MNPLDYPFTPVPDRVGLALQEGKIDRDDAAILGYLYRRADRDRSNLRNDDGRRFFPARQSLEQIAEGVGWTATSDALSKRVRRLHRGGWFAYDAITGRGARYDFRLYPDDPSDFVPSFPSADVPTSDEPKHEKQRGLPGSPASGRSEFPVVEKSTVGPTSGSFGPSSERAATPHELGDSVESRPEAGPSSPESQEQDLSRRESYEDARARAEKKDEGRSKKADSADETERLLAAVGRATGEPSSEAAEGAPPFVPEAEFLRDLDERVRKGDLVPLDDAARAARPPARRSA